MSADCDHQDQLWPVETAQHVSPMAAANEINIWMASEIVGATDRIASRMLKKVRAEYPDAPGYCDQIAANIMSIRRDIQSVASRIVDKCALDKEERIDRVREALDLNLKVAAALLLELVDDPGRPYAGRPIGPLDDGLRRRMAVYASHIRRALRPHGLEMALITMRSRGYLISPPDAVRIRMLWGELS